MILVSDSFANLRVSILTSSNEYTSKRGVVGGGQISDNSWDWKHISWFTMFPTSANDIIRWPPHYLHIVVDYSLGCYIDYTSRGTGMND